MRVSVRGRSIVLVRWSVVLALGPRGSGRGSGRDALGRPGSVVLRGGVGFPAGDDAGAALPGDVGPDPVEEDHDAVAEADEEEEVDGQPDAPSRPTSATALLRPMVAMLPLSK